jgi:beta-ureidopropionase / N-carbamoyl-L-amino-acid hydrolase
VTEMTVAARFSALWHSLLPIGRVSDDGGYLRRSWSPTDFDCREWFVEEALDRDLRVETDGNGNLWAWWDIEGAPDTPAVVTGSHLDSVPGGGAYDGALGVVSALLAVDILRDRGVTPRRPIAVVVFTEEEGARFGVPCLGSRLITGAVDPQTARNLTDSRHISLEEAMTKGGMDAGGLGPDPQLLGRITAFVELHVEQGRALAELDAPVGVGTRIWPHGRWRLDLRGTGNHAGTTAMTERHDPMLTFAFTVLAANEEARLRGAHATVGRVKVSPNATNAIPGKVQAWLDARAPDVATLTGLIDAIRDKVTERARHDGTSCEFTEESLTSTVEFDATLRENIVTILGGAPTLATGAGHDAGVLAPHVPTAMLFVRNPSGVSHSPQEYATDEDCAAGVAALADVLEALACK